MATSRTFSRVVRTTVLKTPATAMAANTSARPAITPLSRRKAVFSSESL